MVLDGTEPLFEPILIHYQWDPEEHILNSLFKLQWTDTHGTCIFCTTEFKHVLSLSNGLISTTYGRRFFEISYQHLQLKTQMEIWHEGDERGCIFHGLLQAQQGTNVACILHGDRSTRSWCHYTRKTPNPYLMIFYNWVLLWCEFQLFDNYNQQIFVRHVLTWHFLWQNSLDCYKEQRIELTALESL